MSAPENLIPAAEYGRRIGISKAGVSRLLSRGMPFTEGRDGDGRICKFIDPAAADRWRAVNCTPKLDLKSGRLMGVPDLGAQASALPPEPAPPRARPASKMLGQMDQARQNRAARAVSAAQAAGDATGALDAAVRIQTARAQREEDITITQRLKRLAVQGQLLDRDAALDAHESFVRQVAVLIDRMPADQATLVAAAIGCTEHQAFLALRDACDRLRGDLAAYAERERDRLGLEEEIPEPDDLGGLD